MANDLINNENLDFKKIHFIGIGGAALSALARMARELGYEVQGSDAVDHDGVKALRAEGFKINVPQEAAAIDESVDLVIKTAAATRENGAAVEILKADQLEIPVYHREFLIDQLVKNFTSIGVAGTHGKTTTTSLLTHALIKLNQDPSYLIGGILQTTGTNAHVGKGKYFTWEADEFADAFHGVHLNYAIINNTEYDHPDYFATPEIYYASFAKFIDHNAEKVVINIDDEFLSDHQMANVLATFGRKDQADYRLTDIISSPSGLMLKIEFHDAAGVGRVQQISAKIYGQHNAYNIAGVFALLHKLGFAPADIAEALASFTGAGRRFEQIYAKNNVTVISDYGHHPTAVRTTIAGAKATGAKVIAVFEPHQYKRVAELLPDYADIFTDADEVILLPIYASRDSDTSITSTEILLQTIQHPHKSISNYEDIIGYIKETANNAEQPTMFLCMSAGSLDEELRHELSQN